MQVRSAKTAQSTLSIALHVENPTLLVGLQLRAELHTGSCHGIGTETTRYVPYHVCPDGVACSSVPETQSGNSLHYAALVLDEHSVAGEYEGVLEWPVHVPNTDRRSLSVVVLDPAGSGQTMCCAQLSEHAEKLYSKVYSIGHGVDELLPHFESATTSVYQTGHTSYSLTLSALATSTTYRGFVYGAPCRSGGGSELPIAARFKRNQACAATAEGQSPCASSSNTEASLNPGTSTILYCQTHCCQRTLRSRSRHLPSTLALFLKEGERSFSFVTKRVRNMLLWWVGWVWMCGCGCAVGGGRLALR
jgi:hypothetical protein